MAVVVVVSQIEPEAKFALPFLLLALLDSFRIRARGSSLEEPFSAARYQRGRVRGSRSTRLPLAESTCAPRLSAS